MNLKVRELVESGSLGEVRYVRATFSFELNHTPNIRWLPEAGGFVTCPLYDRDRLDCGNRILGPAIVEQMDATTVILPNTVATVEPYLNLIVEAV